MDNHKRPPTPTPVRDAGIALLMCGIALAVLGWLNVELAGWPAAFLTFGAFLVGIWTAHAVITLSAHEKGTR